MPAPREKLCRKSAAKKIPELGWRLADKTIRNVRRDRNAKLLALIRLEHQENPEHQANQTNQHENRVAQSSSPCQNYRTQCW